MVGWSAKSTSDSLFIGLSKLALNFLLCITLLLPCLLITSHSYTIFQTQLVTKQNTRYFHFLRPSILTPKFLREGGGRRSIPDPILLPIPLLFFLSFHHQSSSHPVDSSSVLQEEKKRRKTIEVSYGWEQIANDLLVSLTLARIPADALGIHAEREEPFDEGIERVNK